MSKINILIVEDEPFIAKDLAFMLEDLHYNIAGIAYSGEDALKILASEQVDLAILDINIEGEMNGIELARRLQGIPFIYLTSHSSKEVVSEAKKTEPLAYLVKPIDERVLLTTIDVAFYNYQQKKLDIKDDEKSLLNDTLFIKSNHTYVKVKVEEILFVEANDNYCFVVTKEKKFLLSQTLKSIEQKLSQHGFIRVHRSYLINPERIQKFTEVSVYINNFEIPISRKYKSAFKSNFDLL